uniref:Uncharacterized protein n=1 Tax=Arundo donax TaxID=35708 RepID=A0A0A9A2L6_ARUDO
MQTETMRGRQLILAPTALLARAMTSTSHAQAQEWVTEENCVDLIENPPWS